MFCAYYEKQEACPTLCVNHLASYVGRICSILRFSSLENNLSGWNVRTTYWLFFPLRPWLLAFLKKFPVYQNPSMQQTDRQTYIPTGIHAHSCRPPPVLSPPPPQQLTAVSKDRLPRRSSYSSSKIAIIFMMTVTCKNS